MKEKVLIFPFILIIAITFTVQSGCLGSDDEDDLSGRLSVATNHWQAPFVNEIASMFMAQNPGSEIIMEDPGSCPAIKMLGNGRYDAAVTNRDLDDSERSLFPQMVKYTIAHEAIVIIVHRMNDIRGLSIEQLRGIFNGTYTSWKDVGGEEIAIDAIVSPDSALSSHLLWRMVLEKDEDPSAARIGAGDADVLSQVSSGRWSIGCVRMDLIDDSIRTVPVLSSGKDHAPTMENAKSGTYPLSNRIYYLTMGDPRGLEAGFLDAIRSDEGKMIISAKGYIPA